MKHYTIKEKLKNGQPVFGTFVAMGSPAVTEVLSNAGFDFLVIDDEHAMMTLETEGALMAAMRGFETMPAIRVAGNDQTIIKRALDAGAAGLMIPMVSTGDDAKQAIASCLYPPAGVRGVGGGRASLYGADMMYFMQANSEILKIIQIEHIDAVNNIDAILSVSGIDVAFVGPTDLSCSMGHMGNPGHPDVVAAIEKTLAAAKEKGIAAGIYCFSVEEALGAVAKGYRFISVGLDAGLLAAAAGNTLNAIHEHLK